MAYQYKMVQVPQDVTVKMKEQRGNEAAAYLESIANTHAADGWEFYRVDEVGVLAQPGYLGFFVWPPRRVHGLLRRHVSAQQIT